ncbi:MAG: 2'-5' RNA ligase family protein, partial [Saprospiraceae bacterium]
MKQSGIVMPGYKITDYMLILPLPHELSEKIGVIRDNFNEKFKVPSTPSKPNLMIASFKQFAMMEERIINRLHTIAMGYPPFKVELRDFGSFPSHTIYIGVTSKIPVQGLVKKVRSDAQALLKLDNDNKPYFALEPHLTIGRKLKPWQYEKAWLEYSTLHFTGRFIASEMVLLKRNEGDRSWQLARHFEFQNLPVETKQGQ